MKDAFGHGSNDRGRMMLGNSGIGLAANARFSIAPRPMPQTSTNDRVAELRTRLSQPKPGMAHAFMQGVKRAMGYTS